MNQTLSITGLFLEGLLSFFTPCVLPLVPLYIGYLTQDIDMSQPRRTVRIQTVLVTFFFVLGISTVFFLAGLGSTQLRALFTKHQLWFHLVGGILLLFFGLYALGVIQIPFLEKERRLTKQIQTKSKYLNAFLLGFFFSFAWSPCVGPLLASAIVAASSAPSSFLSWAYIGAYTLGFITMFILIGLFTEEVLGFLKKHRNVVRYTKLLGGFAVLGMGIYTLSIGVKNIQALQMQASNPVAETVETSEPSAMVEEEDTRPDIQKYDLSLKNQDNETVTLSSYTGKTVILNFFGTWCHYCNQELPYLQEIQDSREDVKVLLVSHPNVGQEGDIAYVKQYMEEAGYSMDILFDEGNQALSLYGISGFPTTFVFKPDGNLYGYAPGYIPKENIIEALDSIRNN